MFSHFSLIPLYIEMFFDDIKLSSGTGSTVLINDDIYLLTNRHNLTGRNNYTNKCISPTLATPNKIKIHHHVKNTFKKHTVKTEDLLNDVGEPIWHEHPTLKSKVDVVALKLTNLAGTHIVPLNEIEPVPFSYGVTSTVSVIGYPYGIRAEGFPVWVTGSVATDPLINFDNLPISLINCSSRSGMSGSPVIIYKSDGQTADIDGFGTRAIHDPSWRFLGIYSSRISPPMEKYESSDLGHVWKAEVIYELLESLC